MLAAHMTWEEYRDVITKNLIILPVGSLEQHGPHLPLNVDVVIPSSLAKMVAEKRDAIVLPTIAYGYKSHPTSGGGQLFPGTTSLNGITLIFLMLNGHYENIAFVNEAVEIFAHEVDDAKVITLCWWDLVSEELVDEIFAEAGFPGWDTEHAGITETSLMQYFAPELVREDKIIDDQSERKPAYSIFPAPADIIPKSGVLYKATYASREIGQKLAEQVVDTICQITNQEF